MSQALKSTPARRRLATLVTCLLLPLAFSQEARAVRAIPDDNLAYPVLITLSTGQTGSGFFLNTSDATYLVTAKHVLYDEKGEDILAPTIELRAYGKDPTDPTPLVLKVEVAAVKADGHVRSHPTADVAVIKIGRSVESEGVRQTQFTAAVSKLNAPKTGFVGVSIAGLKKFDDVLISNDVLIFGYPTSIGLRQLPQLDYSRPLLRRGLVAGKNLANRTIVIDCSV